MLTPDVRSNPETITYVPEAVDLFLSGGMWWAGDSTCYAGKNYSLPWYLNWMDAWRPYQKSCLFMTAPDVVGNAQQTWGRSMDVLPIIRDKGYKAAFVAQDGIWRYESDRLVWMDIEWDAFDCLFVGGTDDFKLEEPTFQLAAEAKRRGKWVHMGRVNSGKRFTAALLGGYDSVDGTYIVFGPDINIPKTLRWLDKQYEQPPLFDLSVASCH